MEEVVVTAERDGKDTNGQRVIFTDGNEHGYIINDTVIVRAPLKSLGSVDCGDGLSVEKFKIDVVQGTTIGHTHPNSYGFPGSVPGPGDNQAAQASSAKTASTLTSKKMWSDGHGYIGIMTLDDGSCINVSLPENLCTPNTL